MKKIIYLISTTLLLLIGQANCIYAQAKIKSYFNHPVTTSASTGVDAVYLPSGTMSDTIVAYIKRAKYSIDIAQYDYNQSSNDGAYANIAAAVDSAYTHGVTVRWIYDGSSSNSGLSDLNPGIHTLGSPTTSEYGIMHNKFIIIDANSSNPDDAIVCTGSEDWSSEMFYDDYNNILFIQDSALAYAYTAEFNMMWGSTTATPNTSLSKFGPYKTDLGLHNFTIAGHQVNLYFSPSDGANTYVENAILSANTDLYVGVYDMTQTANASNIVSRKDAGVYTLALVDQYTPETSTSVNSTLSSGLGSNYVVYSGYYLYHNKMMIVDPSDVCSDPQVETGSYNWTSSANEYNDENILILHNDTLANIYYQSFINNFTSIGGGSVTTIPGCAATKVNPLNNSKNEIVIYPNPATTSLTISANNKITALTISDLLGQIVFSSQYNNAGEAQIDITNLSPGVYFVKVNGNIIRKFLKE